MGSILICEYLVNGKFKDNINGAILLSPPFAIKSFLFSLTGFLTYFIKYQSKGPEIEQFFEKYNLFSYKKRSVSSINEFKKLHKKSKEYISDIKTPVISFLAENDELIDVKSVSEQLEKYEIIENHLIPDLDHIFTVYKEAFPYFDKINGWINEQLKK